MYESVRIAQHDKGICLDARQNYFDSKGNSAHDYVVVTSVRVLEF